MPAMERPTIPQNVKEMNGIQLGDLMTRLTAYLDFVDTQYALEKAKLNQYDHELELIRGDLEDQGIVGPKSLRKSPAYRAAKEKALNQKRKVLLVEKGILNVVKGDIKLVSRLITVWEKELEANVRETNANNRKFSSKNVGRITSPATIRK